MVKRILLVGGDEFRASCAGMDRHVLEATGAANPRVAIVPTAAAFENPGLAASNGVRHFAGLGASAYGLDVVSREDAENPRAVAQLDGAHVIYFTGGSPEHLHSVLAGSPLLEAVNDSVRRRRDLGRLQRRRHGPGFGDAPPLVRLARVAGVGRCAQRHGSAPPRAQRPEQRNRAAIRLRNRRAYCAGYRRRFRPLVGFRRGHRLGSGNVTVYRSGQWRRYAAGEQVPDLTVNGPAS